MYNNEQKNDENFWISYADLMAGLLFVFILVIGAIIVKYLYTQNDLQVIKTDLEKEKQALNMSEEELSSKKKKLEEVNEKFKLLQDEKVHLSFELAKSQNMFDKTKKELEEQKKQSEELSKILDNKNKDLQLSLEQIEEITAILEGKENSIKEKTKQLSLNQEEIEKLKALLLAYEVKTKDFEKENTTLSSKLSDNENIIKLKDDELVMLQKKLLLQSNKHQKLVEEFDITKIKIKHLTGIKLNVISNLREKLGKSINIDEKSGAIKFSSNILFDQGEYKLKEDSKQELSLILKKYFDALLEDNNIKQYIQSITIEGHTNSDGSYLDNLQLSQKRALEVMQFLYQSNIIDKDLISKYVNSSGRSFSNLVYKNGIEDKDNSRRIEIKFTVKNESAIKELQNFLNTKQEKKEDK
ncbi:MULTISPECIES: OmpA family protein [Arcobacteraceae]|uniref:Chemotaxis protein n=1 Tax=Poseidonibacter parvus TaxID=1850254 RepID=A0A1P8KPV9_9BACT|nr:MULTISPECIES: OmpA family protein [Arcobacteraceae]APW66553.1 chemotaxis protein [Poseidonibacter parvus]